MYAWIWRKLPFGMPGKLIGSVLLIAATVALLWYVIFPVADPYLPPYDDVQVGDNGGGSGAPGAGPGKSGQPDDPYQPQYRTDHNNPEPTGTRR